MRKTANETEHDTVIRILRAIDRQHPITITYTKADGTETIRTIEIYNIEISKVGAICLKAMDRHSGDRRTFRVDRIQAYTVHRSAYVLDRPADATPVTPKAFCETCWDLYEADELTAGPSGDPTCGDCRITHADIRAAYAH
ncbi:WYL domain-containing protein [Streptomyces sp. TLI_235]|nr:WYL domain-containing protein [Streptomyces sp. TLI_235]PBC80139.1 WYL domain-containing protein [Streptomyces sp. TLI_235]